VEGMNLLAILLIYPAGFAIVIGPVAAIGLLIARRTRAALGAFAGGLWATAIIQALATLTYLDPQFNFGLSEKTMLVLTALSLVLAGAGQFVAALRSLLTYAAAFGCAAGSMMFLSVAWLGGSDVLEQLLGQFNRVLAEISLTLAAASLVLALASTAIAFLLGIGSWKTG
jgi:hypothetical protein